MLYLSGRPLRLDEYAYSDTRQIGCILTPRRWGRPERLHLQRMSWAADNGCFTQGDSFRVETYLTWLDSLRQWRSTCLFATAPDVLGDAQATLARSLPVLPLLRRRGWHAALVAQDGLEQLRVPWRRFDVLFIGGSTRWKLSQAAADLTAEAKRRGKWVHMGRVNSAKRLRFATDIGCDSADGTHIAYEPRSAVPEVSGWLRAIERQPTLWSA